MSLLSELTIESDAQKLVIRQRRVGAWAMALVVLSIGVFWLGAALRLPHELSFACDRSAGACVLTRTSLFSGDASARYPFADIREIRVDTWSTIRSGDQFALLAETEAGPLQLTPYRYDYDKLEADRDRLTAAIAPGGPDRAEVVDVRALGFAALVPGFLIFVAIGIAALAPFVRIEIDRRTGVLSFTKWSPIHFRTRRERLASITGFEIQERLFGGTPMYATIVAVLSGGARITLCDAKDVAAQRNAHARLRDFLAAPQKG